MQEIEAKRKLRASEGAHFFFTLSFLSGAALIKLNDSIPSCGTANLSFLIDILFYGLVIWATYLLITIIPRYKSPSIKLFFNFLDLIFGLFLIITFIYANRLYYSEGFKTCLTTAPVQAYFTELFLTVTTVIFSILVLSGVTWVL